MDGTRIQTLVTLNTIENHLERENIIIVFGIDKIVVKIM